METNELLVTTGIATALATTLSLLVSLWWRRVDRREADWIAFEGRSEWYEDSNGNSAEPNASCRLANVGDASAYRVRAVGVGCHTSLGTRYDPSRGRQRFELVPSVAPGDEVDLTTYCDPAGWSNAYVVVTWIASPTRRKIRSRRAQVVPLASIADAPRFKPMQRNARGLDERVAQDSPAEWRMPDRLTPQLARPPGRFARRRLRRRLRREASKPS